jgi:hypothetical protein
LGPQRSDVVGDLLYADVLTGEDCTEIDLASSEAQPAALGHGDGLIVRT